MLYVSLAAVGGLLLLLGMLGGLLKERTPVSEPLIALLAGVLIGPAVFGLLDLAKLGNEMVILEEAALVTLGVALVGVALRLPVGYASSNWRLLVVLLGILMPLMWVVSGLLVYLVLGLPFWVAVLIGAIVTPTDPVVASSIVAGGVAERNLPAPLRHAISSESGFNDGLALPFVVLPVLVLTEPPGEVLGHWLTHTVLLEILGGAAVATLMGYLAGKTLRWAERKETMERTSLLTISLALSLTVLGVTELLHLNGVLAAFVAGIVFNFAGSSDAKESQEEIQEAISRFFDLPIFVLLGYGAAVGGLAEARLEGLAPSRGRAAAQATASGAGPEAAARDAPRASEGRAFPRMVRPDRGRSALLRGLLTQRDRHRGSMGGRQPRHVRSCVGPRRERYASYQALREVVSRLKGGVLSEVG